MREFLKRAALALSTVAVLPALLSYRLRAPIFGADRALEGSTQALSLVPGVLGQYLRRAFLMRALEHFHWTATVEFGAIFSSRNAKVDEHVYIGPGCRIGLVHLERDVLLAPGVQIPSGPRVHGIGTVDQPIRVQAGTPALITIGSGSWIGAAAIVMADVGCDSVVGAGAVVTRPVPDRVTVGGVPARLLGPRTDHAVA